MDKLVTEYLRIAELNRPEACGEYVHNFTDAQCDIISEYLSKHNIPRGVRGLWYDYTNQRYRDLPKTDALKKDRVGGWFPTDALKKGRN